MIGDIKDCAREGCDESYTKKTHNQKYHDAECCRLATNAKIMEKYYARRAQRLGHKRYCDNCGTDLSRYNSSTKCNSCLSGNETNRNSSAKSMLTAVLAG